LHVQNVQLLGSADLQHDDFPRWIREMCDFLKLRLGGNQRRGKLQQCDYMDHMPNCFLMTNVLKALLMANDPTKCTNSEQKAGMYCHNNTTDACSPAGYDEMDM
jgi:hypothetical protein